jgi:hypothetical protein
MPKFTRVGNGIFVNLEKRIGFVGMGVVRPFAHTYSIKEPAADVIAQMTAAALAKRNLQAGADSEPANAGLTFDQVQPKDTDYIYPLFRALDAGLIEDYWIDFSKAGVLKKSMSLLLGQTIFTNHGKLTGLWGCRTLDVNDWRGAVNQVLWDEKGEQAGGIPGINNELKIDWTVDPKLARGLLMKPPAIKAVSVSPFFSWDASHVDLLETHTFFQNLGQPIEGGEATPAVPKGDVVRLIVTEIHDYLEESLVVKGANAGSNSQIASDDEDGEELSARLREMLSADFTEAADFSDEQIAAMWQRIRAEIAQGSAATGRELGSRVPSPKSKVQSNAGGTPALQSATQEKETMKIKLTAAQKKALGLENQQGDEFDVEPSAFLAAMGALETRATTAEASLAAIQPFIDAERAEVVRLATLVEGLTGDDKKVTLPPVFADAIKTATPAQLADWKTMYTKRVDEKFAPKCAKCGSTEVSRRSSVDSEAANQDAKPAARIPKIRGV